MCERESSVTSINIKIEIICVCKIDYIALAHSFKYRSGCGLVVSSHLFLP